MGTRSQKRRTSKSTHATREPVASTSSQPNSDRSSPRPSQRPKKSRKSSQPPPQSQEVLGEYVNNCVRYLVYKAKTDMPIRKSDIVENAMSDIGRQYETTIGAAAEILSHVYGFELKYCDQIAGTNKVYFLHNTLPSLKDPQEKIDTLVPHKDKVLVLFILAHIFMSNAAVNENSLFAFLRAIKIDPEINHPVFGSVPNALKILQKKRYLSVETVSNVTMYDWGLRAEAVVSKHELLKFVCKIYGKKNPQVWFTQFSAASKQFTNRNDEDEEQNSDTDFSD